MKTMHYFDKTINDVVGLIVYMFNLMVTATIDVLVEAAANVSCLFRRFAW